MNVNSYEVVHNPLHPHSIASIARHSVIAIAFSRSKLNKWKLLLRSKSDLWALGVCLLGARSTESYSFDLVKSEADLLAVYHTDKSQRNKSFDWRLWYQFVDDISLLDANYQWFKRGIQSLSLTKLSNNGLPLQRHWYNRLIWACHVDARLSSKGLVSTCICRPYATTINAII